MFMLNTKNHYKIAHITNEIGNYIIGGIATVINELYMNRDDRTCFIHIYDDTKLDIIDTSYYPGQEDIFAIPLSNKEKIKLINFDIVVLHFYGLAEVVSEEVIGNRKFVYVVHSVNTTEPYSLYDPFGGHSDIEIIIKNLCHRADKLICVSEVEKSKLELIIRETIGKIEVIYNGLTFDNYEFQKKINENREKFGFLGRIDYRKGILETLMAIKGINELKYYLACGKGDYEYLKTIKLFIQAADMEHRVYFLGYCSGKRRESFLNEIDCLIISSLYEPFGMVLLEALKHDVPVICSNNGGLGEMLGDYKYQYNPYIIGSLENMIKQFRIDSIEIVEAECQKLKEHLKIFTREKMVDSYKQIFDTLNK